jgi:hypothetical protein
VRQGVRRGADSSAKRAAMATGHRASLPIKLNPPLRTPLHTPLHI